MHSKSLDAEHLHSAYNYIENYCARECGGDEHCEQRMVGLGKNMCTRKLMMVAHGNRMVFY